MPGVAMACESIGRRDVLTRHDDLHSARLAMALKVNAMKTHSYVVDVADGEVVEGVVISVDRGDGTTLPVRMWVSDDDPE